jgi:hypothetical protein
MGWHQKLTDLFRGQDAPQNALGQDGVTRSSGGRERRAAMSGVYRGAGQLNDGGSRATPPSGLDPLKVTGGSAGSGA